MPKKHKVPDFSHVTDEQFDKAVRTIAERSGVAAILAIPGVWELVSEEFNNAALDLIGPKKDDT